MARKTSRTILIVLLLLSALIGMLAIGVSYYYSQVDDVTPTDTDAGGDIPACYRIYVIDSSTNQEVDNLLVPAGHTIQPEDKITIGAEFTTPTPNANFNVTPLTDFRFTVNSKVYDVGEDEFESTTEGSKISYKPQFDFSDIGTSDSLTIQVVAIEDGEPMTNIQECQPWIVDVDQDNLVAPPPTCVEEGNTGGRGQSCCEGLATIDCSEVDQSGATDDNPIACTDSPMDCFTCVNAADDGSAQDGECSEGENSCNNIEDCPIEDEEEPTPPPPPPTTQCIELGGTGNPSNISNTCCTGLMAVSCGSVDQATNQCVTQQDCFVCIQNNNDNQCGTGENICNSPNDCPAPVVTPPPTPTVPNSGNLSNFAIALSGPACLERVAPNDVGQFRIIVTNNATTSQTINRITVSAPLGYTFVSGSGIVNGNPDTSNQFLDITTVGSSQQLDWETTGGWPVTASASMAIEFSLVAGPAALSDEDAMIEVVVTPANVGVNLNALRASTTITTSQLCSTPGTGIFNNTQSKIIAGVTILFVSLLFYATSIGNGFSSLLVNSKVGKKVEMLGLKYSNPREHFEVTFEEKEAKSKR